MNACGWVGQWLVAENLLLLGSHVLRMLTPEEKLLNSPNANILKRREYHIVSCC
jgi:hypothetical protein